MKKAIAWVVALLLLITEGIGCSIVATPPPETQPTAKVTVDSSAVQTRTVSATYLSDIIGEIILSPAKYLGQQVEVIGYFRGWNLLNEVKSAPPVTRSDWVIADSSGAIYVTGILPPNLDPASPKDTNKIIRITATVEQNQNGVYLQAVSVEVISTE